MIAYTIVNYLRVTTHDPNVVQNDAGSQDGFEVFQATATKPHLEDREFRLQVKEFYITT